jgi:hypothetical protein
VDVQPESIASSNASAVSYPMSEVGLHHVARGIRLIWWPLANGLKMLYTA